MVASVFLEGVLFVFGGQDNLGNNSNDVYSLSLATGVFKHFDTDGERPSPRSCLEGWHHEGHLFFFAGQTAIERNALGKISEIRSDNHLFSLDLKTGRRLLILLEVVHVGSFNWVGGSCGGFKW